MKLLLGFGNKARQGKDTAAESVVNYYLGAGVPAVSMPFAGALRQETKDAIEQAGGIMQLLANPLPDGTCIPTWVEPDPNPAISEGFPYGKHPKLLQWWGTEYRRAQDPDYWVKKVFYELKNFDGVVVISDVRFVNEFAAIKNNGGFTINITRVNADGSTFVAPDRDAKHISEVALDGVDWDFFLKVKTGHAYLLRRQAIEIARFAHTFQQELR